MHLKSYRAFVLLMLLAATALGQGTASLAVDESSISSKWSGTTLTVFLPLAHASVPLEKVIASGELLDPDGDVIANSTPFSPGKENARKLELRFDLKDQTPASLTWAMLRYRLRQNGKTRAEGLIALGRSMETQFEMRLILPDMAAVGSNFPVQVFAANPVTRHPVRGVNLQLNLSALDSDSNEREISRTHASTSSSGLAVMQLEIPSGITAEEMHIEVKGTLGGYAKELSQDVQLGKFARLNVQTDKPIYQPGQVLHTRVVALLRNAVQKNTAVRFLFLDPEDEEVFRSTATTNDYGIASAEWTIPENMRLGDYTVRVQLADVSEQHSIAGNARVRISRYDLPEFTVTAELNKPYYLPGEKPEIQVNAKYLFGKPVTHGKVRIVRENDRQWNYRLQKWDVQDGEEHSGILDAGGEFRAKFELKEDFQELWEYRYSQFLDLSLAAYVTDATTGRTEQRRFKIRLSRQPIHVYLIRNSSGSSNEPVDMAVATSYPDGTPASCEVVIGSPSDKDLNEGTDSADKFIDQRILRKVQTNRYGIAIVKGLRLADKRSNKSEDEKSENYSTVDLVLTARDGKGRKARLIQGLWFSGRPSLRLSTDKAVYRPGETVHVEIRSYKDIKRAGLLMIQGEKVIHAMVVNLSHGYASLMLPYRESMKGEIHLSTYALDDFSASEYDVGYSERTILFPQDHSLTVRVRGMKKIYEPGEQAVAEITARGADSRLRQSALGVVVVDQAVRERARTDAEFGSRFFGWDWWWNEFPSYGGLTRESLDKLDLDQEIPDDVQQTADVILNNGTSYWYYSPAHLRFSDYEVNEEIRNAFESGMKGQLQPLDHAIDAIAEDVNIPRTEADIRQRLRSQKADVDGFLDPWGNPYRLKFQVSGSDSQIDIISAGPDETFDTPDDLTPLHGSWPYLQPLEHWVQAAINDYYEQSGKLIRDFATLRAQVLNKGMDLERLVAPDGGKFTYEFHIEGARSEVLIRHGYTIFLSDSIDYFAKTRKRIAVALWQNKIQHGASPRNNADFDTVLRQNGISPENLRDPWGRPYQRVFSDVVTFGDSVKVSYDSTAKYQSIPVTITADVTYLKSLGEDGIPDTKDDFVVASYYEPITQRSGKDAVQHPVAGAAPMEAGTGAATGVIVDASGAVIPNSIVTAINEENQQKFSVKTDQSGRFLLYGLPTGPYTFKFDAPGFMKTVIVNVPVLVGTVVEVNAKLQVGTTAEAVTVEAAAPAVNTTSSALAASQVKSLPIIKIPGAAPMAAPQNFTPRLRQYFPETLYWQPFLETARNGRASVRFKLADNIGAWHMTVLASTQQGEIGEEQTDFQAFQPFFADLDPPHVLTEGDEIRLPITLRNYLGKPQTVQVSMKPEDWFALAGAAEKRVTVPAADSANAVFEFHALHSVHNGSQQVTAANEEAGDSIRREVDVHPFGEDKAVSAGAVLRQQADLELLLPGEPVPGSIHGEVKIYPNMVSHVVEAMEAIMHMPYGCAEQTISSTYPSLLLLSRFGDRVPAKVSSVAKSYLLAGYRRLLNYQNGDGGFAYWGSGVSSSAVTAYALQFLSQAKTVIDVNPDVIDSAQEWISTHGEVEPVVPDRTHWSLVQLAYRTKVLASLLSSDKAADDPLRSVINKNLDQIESTGLGTGDPYVIASYVLAASDAGRNEKAAKAAGRLRGSAKHEGNGAYWNLEFNSPFYGWGYTGRLETTALVLQALHRVRVVQGDKTSDPLADAGLIFLLKNKDRYGMWYSTQATINTLEAITAWSDSHTGGQGGKAEVLVNGVRSGAIEIPSGTEVQPPIILKLTSLKSGKNQITIRRSGEQSPATVQAVAEFYRPWTQEELHKRRATATGESSGLQLEVNFDKNTAAAGEEVRCTVEAERFGYRGYGMLLAEIGLPPGADVSRESLEAAMKDAGWAFSRYEILPDRVLAYLWPWNNKVKFTFSFRPRFGMNANTAQSLIYDYYNPLSRAVLAPVHFKIGDPKTDTAALAKTQASR